MPAKVIPSGKEREELENFLAERRESLEDKVVTVLETFIELVTRYPEATREFDLRELHGFMVEKAEQFYSYRDGCLERGISVEKDVAYLYNFASITVLFEGSTLLYPFMLVVAANYQDFIPLLCRRLRKASDRRRLALEDYLGVHKKLLKRCKPRLGKRDIELLKTCSAFDFSSVDFSPEHGYSRMRKIHGKHYQRLVNLQVMALYYAVNFPALGLIPYMHLASKHVDIPSSLTPLIEIEYHPARIKQDYKVFRLFLVPEREESERAGQLEELGRTGKVNDWFIQYNFDLLERTSKGTYRWNLDVSRVETTSTAGKGRFKYMIPGVHGRNIPGRFRQYLEAVHKYRAVADSDLAAKTGIPETTCRNYRLKALKNAIVLPYVSITGTGIDNYYQVCFENDEKNGQLARFLETLPRIAAMKSGAFNRFVLSLPAYTVKKLNRRLIQGEKDNEIELLWRRNIVVGDRTVTLGVNLEQVTG